MGCFLGYNQYMKQCIRCKENKPIEKFENHPTAKDGKRNQCSSCRYLMRLERDSNYRMKQRDWNLGRYGITIKDYDLMLEVQKNSCAICCKKQEDTSKKLFVDHDHTSGKIRGLLCHHCNILLGNAKDDPQILWAAIRYLDAT